MDSDAKKYNDSDLYQPSMIPKALKVIHGSKDNSLQLLDVGGRETMTQETKAVSDNRIHFVFVPVKDMERAVKFYSAILGLTIKPGPYGSLYNLDIASPNIVLDSNLEEGFEPCKHPLFSFKVSRLEEARTAIQHAGGNVKDVVDNSFFVFEDLDGNRLMIVNN
ncbi:VOC family protein [Paenibacillus spongiae]|uniref:VOC family protein n=1 Tax=Paenibacillus spongiae TaxID=2909671 RepID=A0ABY5S683_9BACL|nr:VOC family protein [Paenibacillus spongiae]UVI29424.1 VOC family protein [Paenibacillus spongiae]